MRFTGQELYRFQTTRKRMYPKYHSNMKVQHSLPEPHFQNVRRCETRLTDSRK